MTLTEAYELARSNPAITISAASLTVAVFGFLLTHSARISASFRRGRLTLGGWLGITRSKYKAGFLKSHRELRNIYLDRIEQLDVVATYVPLHILDTTTVLHDCPAIEVLLAPKHERIVILGDPGSGKTTLMKSFGVSLVSREFIHKGIGASGGKLRKESGTRFLPIFVELRDFANNLAVHSTLSEYVIEIALKKHLPDANGHTFFRQLLTRGECIVLLDALDEIGTEHYEAVRQAIHIFLQSTDESLPTSRARVVLTSRYQNFLAIAGDWVPSAFPRYHVLAPFSDDDIQRFLEKRKEDLPPGKRTDELWNEIRQSNTLDLHRNPLILTISLGLYKSIPRYNIPQSIARFYEEVIRELLQRHDFRTRPYLSKRNQFPSEVKLQFLREFALQMALRTGKFDDFLETEMSAGFEALRARNARLATTECVAFLDEIIRNASLIKRISDSGIHVFAHRSFHEYLAALQLSKNAGLGLAELLKRAGDPLWRQITIFFAAMDHDEHDKLLTELAARVPDLAGYCLAVAPNVSLRVARDLIATLQVSLSPQNALSLLGALAAICRSSGEALRAQVLETIRFALTDVLPLENPTSLLGLSPDDLVQLTRDLAATNSIQIVPACVALSRIVKNDARIVSPLWTSLALFVKDPCNGPAKDLVVRLIELAQTEEAFAAFESLAPLKAPFLTQKMLLWAYPFPEKLEASRNLATLLAWLDHCNLAPEVKNGYLVAFSNRAAMPEEWRRIGREISKSPITIEFHVIGTLSFWVGYGGSIGYLAWNFFRQPWPEFVRYHFIWNKWSWLTFISPFGIAALAALLVGIVLTCLPRARRIELVDSPGTPPANPLVYWLDDMTVGLDGHGFFWDLDTYTLIFGASLLQYPLVLAASAVTMGPPLERSCISMLFCIVLFWFPAMRLFVPGSKIDLRRRDPLATAALSDPSSRRWLRI